MLKEDSIAATHDMFMTDLLCFCHLRWDFVFQRPQHLMSRFAKKSRVFFIEEPVFYEGVDRYEVKLTEEQVWVIKPQLNDKPVEKSLQERLKRVVNSLFVQFDINRFIAWYYTPMALKFSGHLKPEMIIYDCMDELSAFKFAPAELKIMETEMLKKAQLVFTGGHCLYEAKKNLHDNIYPFPSSIDKDHFAKARKNRVVPPDQEHIQGLKLGFFGVIDERFNVKLIQEVAAARPDWQLILLGPVVKIEESELPRAANIHYLGMKSYKELPSYLSGWDIAMIPFEKNDSTKYISPTKTPEYLAAGKPVVSTSITDVVNPYGVEELVYITDTSADLIRAVETELAKTADERRRWQERVDKFLAGISWDHTAGQMLDKMNRCLGAMKEAGSPNLKSVA
jgi:glycosyltransferase involved in cell wall biosynthesis